MLVAAAARTDAKSSQIIAKNYESMIVILSMSLTEFAVNGISYTESLKQVDVTVIHDVKICLECKHY